MHGERVANAFGGNGFVTNEEYAAQQKPIDGGVLAIVTVTGAYPLFVFDEHKIWKGGEQDKTYAFIQAMNQRADAETTLLTIGASISAAIIALPIIGLSGGGTTILRIGGVGVAEDAATHPEHVGQATEAVTIQFGRVANQISHVFRHTDVMGLNRSDIKSAVVNDLRGVASQIVTGKPFNQIIEVGGQRIQYTAFRLSDGTINVGRIHGVN